MGYLKGILDFFEAQRKIFGICPCCGEIFRLSDIKISYRKSFAKDWYEKLRKQEEKLGQDQMVIEQTLKEIRKKEIDKVRKQYLPRMLSQVDPLFTPLGYYPQDVKAVFDPLDFVIFDGMNREGDVKRVVFMDENSNDEQIRQVQSSIETAVQKGRYDFQSVRLTKDGQIKA